MLAQSRFDLSPTQFSADDQLDSAAIQLSKQRRCGRYTCCAEDAFGTRLWNRIKLYHVAPDNSPFYIFLKIGLVIILALLLDKGTRNPDSITSVLIGVLGLAPYLELGKRTAIDTLIAGLLGACIGTAVHAACYLPPEMDPNDWMQLVSVTLSVLLTVYAIYFIGRDTPVALSAGIFSSLFVIFVQFPYPPIDDFVPDTARRLIWQTLLVRVLALGTAVVSALIVNTIVSATAPLTIYRIRQFFAERLVWKTQKHHVDPVDSRIQANFGRVLYQIESSGIVSSAMSSWLFSDRSRSQVQVIGRRAKCIFRFLTFRSFLELFRENCVESGDTQDLEAVNELIRISIRNAVGGSIEGLSLEQELALISQLPESLHVEKCVLRSILIDLNRYQIDWLPEDKINPFMGRV